MATKGIKLKNVTGDVLLPATNADFVQITHDDVTTNVTSAIIENEQVVAEALVDLNNRVNNIYNQNMMYIGTCSTNSTTAAKIVEVPNFTLETNAIVRVSFVNTNYSYERPTLNVASTGAYNMVGKYGEMITGSMLIAGEWYVFRFDGTQWVLEESSLGDHLFVQLYIAGEDNWGAGILASSYDFVNSPENNYRFFFIYLDGTADIAYTTNLLSNVPQSELNAGGLDWNSMFINGQPWDWNTLTWTAFDWPKNNPITSTKYIQARNSYLYIKIYDEYWLYLNFSNKHLSLSNGCLLCTDWEIKDAILPELKVYVNDNVISGTETPVDANGIISIPYARTSYNTTIVSAAQGGAVSGVLRNDRNQSSGNITTLHINSSGIDIPSSTQRYRTVMRYETPCAYFHLRYKAPTSMGGSVVFGDPQGYIMPNNSSMKARYYFFDDSYLTNKNGNAYSYSSLVLGNNYYDYNTKSLSYWNGDFMSKIITTYSGANDSIFFGSESGRLKIKSNKIYFSLDEDVHKLYGGGAAQSMPLDDDYNVTEIAPDYITSYIIKTRSKISAASGTQTGGNVWRQYNPSVFMCEGKIFLAETENDSNPGVIISSNKMTDGTTSYFTGYITANNDITAAKFYESSDERLKHNIVKLTNSSPAIYSFVKDVNNLNTYGFVAQNVELTNPDLVSYNSEYKTVDYNGTMALLLSQALNRIEKLEAEVKELKTKIK